MTQHTALPPRAGRPAASASDVADERLVGSDRVLAVLKELAAHPSGIGLEEMTRRIGSPKPTVHRALSSLRKAGLAGQDARGHYLLGDEFLRMAFAHHEARPDQVRILPALETLAARFGETAHYSVLEGREIVYRAKVDPPAGAVRLTSTVGGRNPAHATAVGKVLLAGTLTGIDAVERWIGDTPLQRPTERTLTTADALHAELVATTARGYGIDDQENELGVNCVALPIYASSPTRPAGAVSISALAYRTPLAVLIDALDEVRGALGALGRPA